MQAPAVEGAAESTAAHNTHNLTKKPRTGRSWRIYKISKRATTHPLDSYPSPLLLRPTCATVFLEQIRAEEIFRHCSSGFRSSMAGVAPRSVTVLPSVANSGAVVSRRGILESRSQGLPRDTSGAIRDVRGDRHRVEIAHLSAGYLDSAARCNETYSVKFSNVIWGM